MPIKIIVYNEDTGNYHENGLDRCSCGCERKYFSKKQFNDYIEQFQNIKGITAEAHIFTVDREDIGERVLIIGIVQSKKDDENHLVTSKEDIESLAEIGMELL